jgi:N-glycosidase YbiA
MEPILFYDYKIPPYGGFSNFSRHQVDLWGLTWKTSEAAFQAAKFKPHRMDIYNAVHRALSPMDAATIGRTRSNPIREDWDYDLPKDASETFGYMDDGRGKDLVVRKYKDLVMYRVVLAKFSQHEDLRNVLISTGSTPLIENAIHDPYWGWGCSRIGINRLGKILMYVRAELQRGV